MKYGFAIPNGGPMTRDGGIAALAAKGEKLGFDLVYAVDHVVMPKTIESHYPRSREFGMGTGGRSDGGGPGECLELFGMLGYLAACTTHLRLLSSVMIVPYRPAVLTAKMLATIDVLCGGRLIVGCGVGWMREEFETLGTVAYEARGKATDEFIAAYKELWTSDAPSFEGDHVRFSNVVFEPKPVQKPHPPIWIGGESGLAMRRAVKADGWYPTCDNPKFMTHTVPLYAAAVEKVRGYAKDAGRDPDALDQAFLSELYDENETQTLEDGSRLAYTGSAREIADDIMEYRDAGMTHLAIDFLAPTLEGSFARMEFFAGKVMPLVDD